jgi:sugar lactone lactonase YvrE
MEAVLKRSTIIALLIAGALAVSMHVIVSAQNVVIQNVVGQNVSVVAGVKDQIIGDMFKQRQNEAVSCIFAVNPDQQIFAYNDYRTVDERNDAQIGAPTPLQSSLFAKLLNPFRKSRQPRVAAAEEAWALAWIGLSFTDNGTDYYTGLHPGSPFSPVVPGDTELAAYHFQAASDPVFAATPTHCLLAGIAFTPGGLSAGFVSRFTSTNNQETKANARYDFTKVVTTSPVKPGLIQTSDFFVDKPFIAASANGKVVVAFVVFDESDPTKLSSKIVVFTSNDYGETWPTPGIVVSQPLSRNQSPWILIDPNNDNNVYIGWRVFSNPKFPTFTNAVVGKRSLNGGVTFDPIVPYPVALLLRAYDAPQTEWTVTRPTPITPRSSAYPSAVIDSHGTISVFIQEYIDANGFPLSPLAPLANGKARITQTNSYDKGVSWTIRRAFDYGPGSGPQFMPTAAVTGVPGPICTGKTGPRSRIAVMYYDARSSYPSGSVFIGGGGARFDVRVAESDPCYSDSGRRPVFYPSQQVSRYTVDGTPAHAIVTTPGYGYPAVNAPYRIFNATKSYFSGDYIHITPKISYVLTGTPPVWKATTAASVSPANLPAPVFKGVWADSRDVILPTPAPGGAAAGAPGFLDVLPWEVYRPPHSGLNPAACDNPASRDQNPYAADISDGLYAAAPVTFRDSTGPRAFPVYVENRTALKRFFRLSIDPNAAVQASFNLPPATGAFVPKKTSDVAIGTFSSVTGSIIVAAGFTGPVRVTIQEIVALNGALVSPNGLATALTLNTGGEPTGEGQAESRAPAVDPTPIVTKPFGTIPSGGIAMNRNNPNPFVNPFGDNTAGLNPFGDNPFGDNPFGDNPFDDNTTVFDVTDVTFAASSVGTKAASYSAILNIAGFKILKPGDYAFRAFINRPSAVPGVNGCQTIEKQQPIQVSTLKQPFGDNPFGDNPFGDNPFGDNPFGDNAAPGAKDENVTNSTFYLAPPAVADVSFRGSRPRDSDLYTLRIFQLVTTPFVTVTPAAVTVGIIAHEPDVVQQSGGGFDFQRTPDGRLVRQVSAAGAAIPTSLAFIAQPTNTAASRVITPAVRVQVLDGFGNPITTSTAPVTLALGSNPSGATLSGTLTRNAVEGVATFSDLALNKDGRGFTLVASSSRLIPATSVAFDVLPLAFVSTFADHRVVRVDPTKGTSAVIYTGNGDLAVGLPFNPEDMAVGPDGKVYVCDSRGSQILRMDQDGGHVTVIYAHGDVGPIGPEGPSFSGGDLYFNTRNGSPSGVWRIVGATTAAPSPPETIYSSASGGEGTAFEANGSILIVDRAGRRVLRSSAPFGNANTTTVISQLPDPLGIAVGKTGDIFIAVNGPAPVDGTPGPTLRKVLRFTAAGVPLADYATFGNADSPDGPTFLEFDTDGVLWVVTAQTGAGGIAKLWRIDATGTKTVVATLDFGVGLAVATRPQP